MVISRRAMQSIPDSSRLVARTGCRRGKGSAQQGCARHPRTHCSRDFPCTGSRQQHMRHSLCPFRPTDSVSGCRAWARTQTGKRLASRTASSTLSAPISCNAKKDIFRCPFAIHVFMHVSVFICIHISMDAVKPIHLLPYLPSAPQNAPGFPYAFHRTGTGPPSSACLRHIPGPVLPGTA